MFILVQQLMNGLVAGSIYALTALGLTMMLGIMDIINFAHGEFYMLGAFFTYLFCVSLGIPYLGAMVFAFLAVGIIGIVIEKLSFKPIRKTPLLNTLLVSLGLSVFLQNLSLLIWGPDPRKIPSPFADEVIEFGGISITEQRLLVIVVTVILLIVFYYFIQKTTMGKCMRATAQEPEGAALIGIDIDRVFLVTFGAGCALAGAAGSLVGGVFFVTPTMGIAPVLKAFIVVIVGGMGSIPGAIAGGFFLGVTEVLVAGFVSSAYMDAMAFGILILVMLFKPSGLFGKAES
ncbi:MAG: branched-chain amino acid ABC transporter permease [bacterium]